MMFIAAEALLFCAARLGGHFIFVAENNGLYRPINPLEDKSLLPQAIDQLRQSLHCGFTLIGVVHQNNAACSAVGTVQNIVQNILRRRGNMERILCREVPVVVDKATAQHFSYDLLI